MRFGSIVAVAVVTVACSAEQLGLPRTPMSVTSPDGQWNAFATNHPNIDPPSQTIWLQPTGGSAIRLRALAPDAEWISAIVWTADSTRVGFLTMDAVLDVYDVATQQRVVSGLVRWPNSGYPPTNMLRNLQFSADAQAVSFVPCERTHLPAPGTARRMQTHISCGNERVMITLAELIERQPKDGRSF